MPGLYRIQLRTAANLAGSASFTSLWCPCHGAKWVRAMFHATTGNTNTLASNAFDVAMDPTIVLTGSGQSSSISQVTGGSGFRLDGTDGLFTLFQAGNANHGVIPWNYLRLTGVNGGAQIDNFEIYAWVYYDTNLDDLFRPFGRSHSAV